MLRKVHIYGQLGEAAGVEELEYDFDTPAQVINALVSMLPEFRQGLQQNPHIALVTEGKDLAPVEQHNLNFPLGQGVTDLHIFPAAQGAGAETAIAAIATYLGTSTIVATVVYIAINVAIAFAIGAIIQALAPSPDSAEAVRAEEKPSFIYNGAINSAAQGATIPLVYGIHTTGSLVISRGVTVEELEYSSGRTLPPAGGVQPSNPDEEAWQWRGNGVVV